MNETLTGKIAFVTGASRGIGRAIALKLAGAGCDVAVAYHNSHEEAEAVCSAMRALGRRALALQTDVAIREALPGRSLLFASSSIAWTSWSATPPSAFSGRLSSSRSSTGGVAWETNAFALNTLAQQARAAHAQRRTYHRYLEFGASRAIPHYAFIGASKAALESVARSLAQELGPAESASTR